MVFIVKKANISMNIQTNSGGTNNWILDTIGVLIFRSETSIECCQTTNHKIDDIARIIENIKDKLINIETTNSSSLTTTLQAQLATLQAQLAAQGITIATLQAQLAAQGITIATLQAQRPTNSLAHPTT
jgi:hypothetical protein